MLANKSYDVKIPKQCKEAINLFIQKTIAYSLKHIENIANLEQYPVEQRQERAQRLQAWQSYLEFQRHTLQELMAGKLDNWFY